MGIKTQIEELRESIDQWEGSIEKKLLEYNMKAEAVGALFRILTGEKPAEASDIIVAAKYVLENEDVLGTYYRFKAGEEPGGKKE